MAYGTAIRQGLRIAGRIDRKYNINKIFIDKYAPPGWRPGLRKIVDIAGTLGGGYGIYKYVTSFQDDDGGLEQDGLPTENVIKTDKSYQTRGRYPRRFSNRYRKCPKDYQYKRRSSFIQRSRSTNRRYY